MANQETSEEKLLKLIRKKKPGEKFLNRRPAGGDNPIAEAAKPGNFYFWGNRFLAVTILGLLGFLGYTFQSEIQRDETIMVDQRIDASQSNKTNTTISIPKTNSFDYYQGKFLERDIFQSPWERPKSDEKISEVVAAGPELNKLINVIGIVLDNNPTVIVEELKSKQTLFMSVNDTVSGAVLKKIHENGAVFYYNGQEIELTP